MRGPLLRVLGRRLNSSCLWRAVFVLVMLGYGELLFGIQLTALKADGVLVDVGLPSGRSEISDAPRGGVIEDLLDLLKKLLGGLGEQEEHVPEHAEAEDGEDNVHLPFDVLKPWWHEVRKGEVEDPVGRGAKRDGLSTNAERVEFWWIDPRDWAPGWCVRGNEEVGACNDSRGWVTGDGHRLSCVVELARGRRHGVVSEERSIDDEPSHHQEGTDKQGRTTTPSVDPEKSWNGHNHVNDELDGRGQQDVAAEAGHGEDVGDVVHHDVHSSPESPCQRVRYSTILRVNLQLRPDLGEDTNVGTVDHVRLEELPVGNIRVGALELDDFSDFLHLLVHEGRVGIALGVNYRASQLTLDYEDQRHVPRASTLIASSQRSCLASHLGDSGRNSMAKNRKMAGSIWRPHGIRNAAVPLMKEQP